MHESRYVIVLFVLLFPLIGAAQVLYPDTYLFDYYKVLELQNTGLRKRVFLQPSNVSPYDLDSLPAKNIWGEFFKFDIYTPENQFRVLPVISSLSINTKYPRGYNDGAIWKGKGMNGDIQFGFRGSLGMLHYTFAPVVYTSQNLDFNKRNRNINDPSYAYQFLVSGEGIDWVQRYGDKAFTKAYPGQSEIRLIHKKLTLGISTQNSIWGPSQINPIVMSNNAGMFPHIDFGTDRPLKTPIGDLELKSYWGIMSESKYFDEDPNNNTRYFQGGGAFLRMKHVPGFSLGMTRIHYRDWSIQKFKVKDLLLSFADFSSNQDTLSTGAVVNDIYDQMVSANFRWAFEEVGFEVYGELARNDFSNIRSLAVEPEHTRASNIGFVKIHELKNHHVWKGSYEHTVIGANRLSNLRGSQVYYTHFVSRAGYTQLGQVLGAGIGPGSSGDHGAIQYYYPKGMFGIAFQRIRFNDDFAFMTFDPNDPERLRPFDVEYTWTGEAVRFLENGFVIGLQMAYSDRLNWYYEPENDVGNFYAKLTIGYQPFN